MNIKHLFLCATLTFAPFFCANAATNTPPIFSQYGQIQNVQNYSSNPFWNPNGPYNQRAIPSPIYVTGPDVDSGDCQRTVLSLVTWFCDANNRCKRMQLSDVRPTIMVQLSQLPGHNYATACAGYLDSAFEHYKNTNSANTPSMGVAFPVPTEPNPTYKKNVLGEQITEFYATPKPQWQQEEEERAQQLKQWQAQQ